MCRIIQGLSPEPFFFMFYHVLPSVLEFCLFHHIIDAQFQNFAKSVSRAKDLLPLRERMEFTPLVLVTYVSYPHSNVLRQN